MIRTLTLLTLLALPTALPAQELPRGGDPAEQAASAGAAVPDPASGTPDSEDDTTATATPPAAARDRDPTDYQASEQISEDLSVSFPVDI